VVLAKELGVVSVPTLIFVNKDREIERTRGLVTEHSLRQKIEELLRYTV
jgi:predicted DsbA family dithiol-disulfide isomerase